MQNSMTTIDTKISNMDNKISSLHDDIQHLKTKHEEAIDLAKQAMATSAGAQNQANEAIEMTKDNSLKINKIEQKVKIIENMQTDINS